MPKTLSPIESFLAPLAKLAAKHPEMEAEVIWATATGWEPQADAEAMMDAEEAPFYAEGLLMEGFTVTYQVLAEAESPKLPVHIRLFCSQPGTDPGTESGSPTAPPPEDGLTLLATGRWPV